MEIVLYIFSGFIAVLFTKILFDAVWVWYAKVEASTKDRMAVMQKEDTCVVIFSGELSTARWSVFQAAIRSKPKLRLKVVFGPTLVCSDSDFGKAFDANGKLVHVTRLLEVHPLLQFFKEHNDRIELWVKWKYESKEKHFILGESSGVVFCELPHGTNPPGPGFIFHVRQDVLSLKKEEFRQLTSDPELCSRVTLDNWQEILSKLTILPAEKVWPVDPPGGT